MDTNYIVAGVAGLSAVVLMVVRFAFSEKVSEWKNSVLGLGLVLAAVSALAATYPYYAGHLGLSKNEGYEYEGADLDEPDILDLGDEGIEEVAAMRSGLAAKSAPYSGAGMSGEPGDYTDSGDHEEVMRQLAADSGMLGASISDDELAAWSGLQNPGASETMIISHGDLLGIDTVGQTKRNMTRDIRGEPVIPPKFTSPFGQSTITRGDLDNVYLTLPNA